MKPDETFHVRTQHVDLDTNIAACRSQTGHKTVPRLTSLEMLNDLAKALRLVISTSPIYNAFPRKTSIESTKLHLLESTLWRHFRATCPESTQAWTMIKCAKQEIRDICLIPGSLNGKYETKVGKVTTADDYITLKTDIVVLGSVTIFFQVL